MLCTWQRLGHHHTLLTRPPFHFNSTPCLIVYIKRYLCFVSVAPPGTMMCFCFLVGIFCLTLKLSCLEMVSALHMWSAISYIYTDCITCLEVLCSPICYSKRKLITSLGIIWLDLNVLCYCCSAYQQYLTKLQCWICYIWFGIACAQWYAFSDIVTVYVNKDAVIVFIPFYFCNKNVILFSHNWNKVV